ncbi:MAG: hypothetical protein HGB08_01060 [Candidatus Moranbacteria bacterium]|nr:hypothetical protein [Candidatus Moranbacteria bacterium]
MQKEELLKSVENGAKERTVTREEVMKAFDDGAGKGGVIDYQGKSEKRIGFSQALYYIGGFIVFLGIAVLIGENWDALGVPVRIAVTLGSGIAAYVAGVILSRSGKFRQMSIAFHLIAALVLPIGLLVTFDSAGYDAAGSGINSLVSLILVSVYIRSYLFFKRNIFLVFSVIFGTWFFYAICAYMFEAVPDQGMLFQYLTLILGVLYIFLGRFFSEHKNSISGALFGFGSLFVLGSAMALGGWSPDENIFWEAAYPIVIFGMIYLGIHLKRKIILILSSAFLMVYILKLTGEYFADSLGWPLALVFSGLALIAVGYYMVYLNKKYIKK